MTPLDIVDPVLHLLSQLRYQAHRGEATTMGPCPKCLEPARGSRQCVGCLREELERLLGGRRRQTVWVIRRPVDRPYKWVYKSQYGWWHEPSEARTYRTPEMAQRWAQAHGGDEAEACPMVLEVPR